MDGKCVFRMSTIRVMDELRRIDLNLLLALHALLTERHVTRAALRLHRSQPAVSHALAQLREVFKDPLLSRRGRTMMLTPRAQEVLVPLEAALAQLNGLLRPRPFDPSLAVGRIRMALSDYAAHLLLPSLVARLRCTAPQVDLAVSQASRESMLAQLTDGEIDLALGVFPEASSDITRQALFEERFVSVADRRTVPRRGRLSLADWLARPHVLVAMRWDKEDEIDAALAARGLRRRIALVLPHWSAAPEVVVGTDLVLTVASRTLEGAARRGSLKAFAPPIELPGFAFEQAWHARRDADQAHRWFRGLVAECSLSGRPD